MRFPIIDSYMKFIELGYIDPPKIITMNKNEIRQEKAEQPKFKFSFEKRYIIEPKYSNMKGDDNNE